MMDEDLESWLLYIKDVVKLDQTKSIPYLKSPLKKTRIPHIPPYNIESTIDLHGLTQEQAFTRLKIFLENASLTHQKQVIIITGKGNLNQPSAIKLAVPRWLEYTELKQYISGYSPIQDKLGGSGAVRVVIKREKRD